MRIGKGANDKENKQRAVMRVRVSQQNKRMKSKRKKKYHQHSRIIHLCWHSKAKAEKKKTQSFAGGGRLSNRSNQRTIYFFR